MLGGGNMRIQRNTIYVTLMMSILSAIIYAYCIFGWTVEKSPVSYQWNTYVSNMILGIWGSSIISLVIGFVSYKECRKKCLERFIFARRALFNHCCKFKENNSSEWFDEYVNHFHLLNDSWSDIWFLIDPRRHRLFLKRCVDYYGDFIQLTQAKYFLLTQSINDEAKQDLLNDINEIVINKRTVDRGIMHFHIEENRFTHDMEMVIKNIDDIYRNKGTFKKYVFDKSLLTESNFTILESKYENYIKGIKKEIDKENKTEVAFEMPLNDANYLLKTGYLSGYTSGDNKMTSKVNCSFILDHYFDMKKRVKKNE